MARVPCPSAMAAAVWGGGVGCSGEGGWVGWWCPQGKALAGGAAAEGKQGGSYVRVGGGAAERKQGGSHVRVGGERQLGGVGRTPLEWGKDKGGGGGGGVRAAAANAQKKW